MLDSFFDSAPIGDSQTTFATVKLVGLAFANATVVGQTTGTSATADASGEFAFANVALNLGANAFTVEAKDIAGNISTYATLARLVLENKLINQILRSD